VQALPQTLAQRLIQAGLAKPTEIVGCSDAEIEQLEQRFRVSLPVSYKYFMRIMGKMAGRFELDAMWTCDALGLARIRAEAILAQGDQDYADAIALSGEVAQERFVLPATAFVFLASAYDFIYFDTTAGSDPPVFLFQLGDLVPSNSLPSFSEWVRNAIEEYTPPQL
jgi:hypothetical protein